MSYLELDKTSIEKSLLHLTGDSIPQWGKLSPQQMVEHLSAVVLISIGKIKMDVYTPEAYLEKSKAFLMSDKAMPVEYNAPFIKETDLILRNSSLQDAKNELLSLIDSFYEYYQKNPANSFNHPVFGLLNHEEWIWLHRKHITHHFKQFGLV